VLFFLGCALVVAHYYGIGSAIGLLAAVGVAALMMRLLSKKRVL
jgi:hypothetical protein